MYSLSNHHTFGLENHCLDFRELNSDTDIKAFCTEVGDGNWYLLGEGSNTVFTQSFDGQVVKLNTRGKKLVERNHDYLLNVKAGENWHNLVVWCLARGIFGFENLALIPGSVGAAPIQNIGAYGVEIERFIESVEYLDLKDCSMKSIQRADCQFGYRSSVFKQSMSGCTIITSVNFVLPKKWRPEQSYHELQALENPTAKDIFDCVVNIRQRKLPDPKVLGNAGSFFKNPVVTQQRWRDIQARYPSCPGFAVNDNQTKVAAAWLIDQLGFKGKRVGGISCHPNQALVLTNDGTGTGEELLNMARNIKQSVHGEFGIELENEVRLIGKTGMITL